VRAVLLADEVAVECHLSPSLRTVHR
jgi:hypothetical protein